MWGQFGECLAIIDGREVYRASEFRHEFGLRVQGLGFRTLGFRTLGFRV